VSGRAATEGGLMIGLSLMKGIYSEDLGAACLTAGVCHHASQQASM
jgi:hypothetical protein